MDDGYMVVVPVFNGAAFVGAAIRSILSQTIPPHRIIVIDDGSTDRTAAEARRCGEGVEVISQNNAGPGAACTRGMDLVDAPFMAFLDADDIWLADKAAAQLARLRADTGLDGLFTHCFVSRSVQPPFPGLPTQPCWGRSAFVVRTERARAVGPMIDQPGRRGEMIDWIARARTMGLRFEMMAEALMVRRVHENSLTFRRGANDAGYLAVAKAALDRRRSSSQ
jgi:glycosyltransferase involved in cell wall biosynthesis